MREQVSEAWEGEGAFLKEGLFLLDPAASVGSTEHLGA